MKAPGANMNCSSMNVNHSGAAESCMLTILAQKLKYVKFQWENALPESIHLILYATFDIF